MFLTLSLLLPLPSASCLTFVSLEKKRKKKKTQLSPFCLFVVGSSMAEDLLYFDVPLGIDLETPTNIIRSQTKV